MNGCLEVMVRGLTAYGAMEVRGGGGGGGGG